jgi:hypothetical protein
MGVQRHSERLQHGRVGIAQGVGHRVQQRRGPPKIFAQAAVIRAVPGKADRRAEVAIAFQALLTRSTWTRRVNGDTSPIVGPALHDTGELVTEHERVQELGIPDATFGEPVKVGAAQTHRGHADEALPGAGRGLVLISNPYVAHAMEADHVHG